MKRKNLIPVNSFSKCLINLFSQDEKPVQESMVSKSYGGGEDNFLDLNNKLQSSLNLKPTKENYQRDLKKFGTRIKLIDVADDSNTRKKQLEILPLKKPVGKNRFKETYEQDLLRFGTTQKVIDVANDLVKKKKKKPLPADFSAIVYKRIMNQWNKRPLDPHSQNPYTDIFAEFPNAQITVTNNSPEEKEVTLWGANKGIIPAPPSSFDVQDHILVSQISVSNGIHPQGIVFNPINQFVYVANQLSGTVTVINILNEIVKVIQLEPSFAGLSSPVALAVNTNLPSTKCGFVYVACSVANQIAVIDLSNVAESIAVGVRPLAVAYNPVNDCIYTTNLVSGTLSVFNAENNTEVPGSPFPTGIDPIGIGVNPLNGDIYVANSIGNNLTVYNSSNTLVTTITGVGQRPVSITYNPANDSMYVVATNSNTVYQINTASHSIISAIPVGVHPYNSFFDTANNFLYVQNRDTNTLTVIKSDNQVVATLNLGEQNIGGAYSSANNSIYVSDTSNNTINVIGYKTISSSISIDPDYFEMREAFQGNPAIIQHAKFIVTGPERLNTFRLEKFTPTGTIKSKAISFEQFASPQSALNIAEVTSLAGTVIDGKMNWRFKLPALHTVSIILWFRQFQVKDILY